MTNKKKYGGVIVPAITPLTAHLQIDGVAVARLFARFYEHSISPFILGTTGEAPSVPVQVKKDYIHAAAINKKEGTLLYVGTGSNILETNIELAAFAASNGADVLVATLPSYYQLTDQQMKDYFLKLADSISLPLFMYNIPATTHMSIPLAVIDELSHHPNIVGIKDSERSEERMKESIRLWKDRTDFHYILGWAAKSAEALWLGADGLVPSTGNLYPEIYQEMMTALAAQDKSCLDKLQKRSDEYGALYQANRTLGESLKELKRLMKEKGICEDYMMPPL